MVVKGLGWRDLNSSLCRSSLGFSHTMVPGSTGKYLKRQEVEAASHVKAWDEESGTVPLPLKYIGQADTEPTNLRGHKAHL